MLGNVLLLGLEIKNTEFSLGWLKSAGGVVKQTQKQSQSLSVLYNKIFYYMLL